MRVIVTGGTGFIGRALVDALAARGDEVIVLSRGAATPAINAARFITWSFERDDDAGGVIESADAVVHLAGAGVADERWTDARLALLRSSRVGPTKQIARLVAAAARDGKGPKVLVSGSAVGIYGMRKDDAVLDETAAPGADVLAEITVDWEAAADLARDAGVRVNHPRTGIVLGKGGGALARMVTPFRFFAGGPIGDGDQWTSWIHLRDEVRALLFAIDEPRLTGPFNVTAPTPVTNRELSRAIGAALGRPSALAVPAFALKLAVGEGIAEMLLTGQRVVPKKLLDLGFAFDFSDVGVALRDVLAA